VDRVGLEFIFFVDCDHLLPFILGDLGDDENEQLCWGTNAANPGDEKIGLMVGDVMELMKTLQA
jgi:hypothetical protein